MMRKWFVVLMLSFAFINVSHAQGEFRQQGVASFYPDRFQGRTMASGEQYDKNKHTCAHMSLPFGTVLRVTNLDNGKTTLVRVNDRGPYASRHRIIDVSRIAAQDLGFISMGTANVKIESVSADEFREIAPPAAKAPEAPKSTVAPRATTTTANVTTPQSGTAKPSSPTTTQPPRSATEVVLATANTPSATTAVTPTASTPVVSNPDNVKTETELFELTSTRIPASGFAVQIASLTDVTNLFNQVTELRSKLLRPVRVLVGGSDSAPTFKLLLGPYQTMEEAKQERDKLKPDFPGCFIVTL